MITVLSNAKYGTTSDFRWFIFTFIVGVATLLFGAASSSAQSCTVLDNFNRANSTNVGPNWVEGDPDISISNNRAVGTNNSNMRYVGPDGGDGTRACADIFVGAAGLTQYAGVIIKWTSPADNFMVKVQDNDQDGSIERIYFYQNGNGVAYNASCGIQLLTASVTAARLTASIQGNVITATLDTDFNGSPDQIYQCGGAPAKSGTGIGLGFFGTVQIDNFGVSPPTAAGVTVSGRVLTSDGRGLRNATVTMTGSNGVTRSVRTATFGYYRFDDVESGQVMTFTVKAKRASFTPQVVYVGDSIADLDFIEGGF